MVQFATKKNNNELIQEFLNNGGQITICPPGRVKKLERRGYVWKTGATNVRLKDEGIRK